MDGTVGDLIRQCRESLGFTVQAFAQRLGTSKATVSRIENDKQPVSVEMLPKITAETGIPAEVMRPDLAGMFKKTEIAA